ncbi:hypothetical protein V8C44DRAFT_58596 [Trichoderma aethiopicum]
MALQCTGRWPHSPRDGASNHGRLQSIYSPQGCTTNLRLPGRHGDVARFDPSRWRYSSVICYFNRAAGFITLPSLGQVHPDSDSSHKASFDPQGFQFPKISVTDYIPSLLMHHQCWREPKLSPLVAVHVVLCLLDPRYAISTCNNFAYVTVTMILQLGKQCDVCTLSGLPSRSLRQLTCLGLLRCHLAASINTQWAC